MHATTRALDFGVRVPAREAQVNPLERGSWLVSRDLKSLLMSPPGAMRVVPGCGCSYFSTHKRQPVDGVPMLYARQRLWHVPAAVPVP